MSTAAIVLLICGVTVAVSYFLFLIRAKAQKKSISDVARKHFSDLMLNPILGFEEGEDRVLRGYKVQFESRDGKYNCVDMDIERTEKEGAHLSLFIIP